LKVFCSKQAGTSFPACFFVSDEAVFKTRDETLVAAEQSGRRMQKNVKISLSSAVGFAYYSHQGIRK
jgi:hypothetical protein